MKKTDLIVVLGLDEQKKPHAAQFEIVVADAVRKAAKLMGFRTALPKTDEARALAQRLIEGKLFATGRGLVPYVKADVYEQLVQKLELEPEGKDAPPATASPTPTRAPSADPWAELKIGSTVVACERDPDDGWWRATIVAISKDGAKLTLRWLDAPKQPPITLKRHAVALLRG